MTLEIIMRIDTRVYMRHHYMVRYVQNQSLGSKWQITSHEKQKEKDWEVADGLLKTRNIFYSSLI